MLLPAIFGESLFDDFDRLMELPVSRDFDDIDKKLYGKHAARVMKTDVHEHDNAYELDIDLPGFKKEEINLSLENGYLSVSATKNLDKDEKNNEGKLIRQERYAGSMQRSFYVGENITEEEVKAKFENGVLKLTIPKKDPQKAVEQKKYIAIE